MYRIIIYRGYLRGTPRILLLDEVRGIVALTEEQVIRGPDRRPNLAELLDEGACLVAGEEHVELGVRLYPIGTANALARILPHLRLVVPPGEEVNVDPFEAKSGATPNDGGENEGGSRA